MFNYDGTVTYMGKNGAETKRLFTNNVNTHKLEGERTDVYKVFGIAYCDYQKPEIKETKTSYYAKKGIGLIASTTIGNIFTTSRGISVAGGIASTLVESNMNNRILIDSSLPPGTYERHCITAEVYNIKRGRYEYIETYTNKENSHRDYVYVMNEFNIIADRPLENGWEDY